MPAISKLILLISHFYFLGLMYFQEKLNAFPVIKFQPQKHVYITVNSLRKMFFCVCVRACVWLLNNKQKVL